MSYPTISAISDNPEFDDATFDRTKELVERDKNRPCVVIWSVGNGAGDYEDYFELIERYDCVCGGFVWEWCDHAVYKGKTLPRLEVSETPIQLTVKGSTFTYRMASGIQRLRGRRRGAVGFLH